MFAVYVFIKTVEEWCLLCLVSSSRLWRSVMFTVYRLFVHFQWWWLVKSCLTHVTLVGSFSCVNPCVRLKVTFLREAFPTQQTLEGLQPCMCIHVISQVSSAWAPLPTQGTRVIVQSCFWFPRRVNSLWNQRYSFGIHYSTWHITISEANSTATVLLFPDTSS